MFRAFEVAPERGLWFRISCPIQLHGEVNIEFGRGSSKIFRSEGYNHTDWMSVLGAEHCCPNHVGINAKFVIIRPPVGQRKMAVIQTDDRV